MCRARKSRIRGTHNPAPRPQAASKYASPGRLRVEHLPELLGRLQHPGADWEKWSIADLEDWCRVELKSRPHQSAIAILVLSHASGAMLDLVIDSFDPEGGTHSDAALRLKKGDINFKRAAPGGAGGGGAGSARLSPPPPPPHSRARVRMQARSRPP